MYSEKRFCIGKKANKMIFRLLTIFAVCTVILQAKSTGAELEITKVEGQQAVIWKTDGNIVVFEQPVIMPAGGREGKESRNIFYNPIHAVEQEGKLIIKYGISVGQGPDSTGGSFVVRMQTEEAGTQLVIETELLFEQEIDQDIRVIHELKVLNWPAASITLAKINGAVVEEPMFASGRKHGGYFLLGRRAAEKIGKQLIVPAVGLTYHWPPMGKGGGVPKPRTQLAIAADPYCGVQYLANHKRVGKNLATEIRISTRYCGSMVPVKEESRRCVIRFGNDDTKEMFEAFYRTIPEIEPGAQWIHDIKLLYFDYLSDQGKGWYNDLEVLAEKIPPAYRSKVACCVHGWYDYIGRYTYDEQKDKLLDEWVAFIPTRKISMSKAEVHKRIKFGNDLGFRVLFYFGDGLNADSGRPNPHPEWIYKNEKGRVNPHEYVWQGPDTVGKNFIQDPTVKPLRKWYSNYLRALIEEYGDEIYGFVWDETFHISAEWISAREDGYAYADRAMMSLLADLTMQVQKAKKENPNLVFLASDNVCPDKNGRAVPYCLVAHGTFQDSACRPGCWPPGLLSNYRNCIWSCNWLSRNPKGRERNRIATEQFGIPQALTNGWYDNSGPSEMPEDALNEVIDRFLEWAERSP